MYRTCAFCNGKLDGDGGPSGLGVGRRLAFDEWKGRLWVICPKCSRWNLAPLDDRLEQIEAVARGARFQREHFGQITQRRPFHSSNASRRPTPSPEGPPSPPSLPLQKPQVRYISYQS